MVGRASPRQELKVRESGGSNSPSLMTSCSQDTGQERGQLDTDGLWFLNAFSYFSGLHARCPCVKEANGPVMKAWAWYAMLNRGRLLSEGPGPLSPFVVSSLTPDGPLKGEGVSRVLHTVSGDRLLSSGGSWFTRHSRGPSSLFH